MASGQGGRGQTGPSGRQKEHQRPAAGREQKIQPGSSGCNKAEAKQPAVESAGKILMLCSHIKQGIKDGQQAADRVKKAGKGGRIFFLLPAAEGKEAENQCKQDGGKNADRGKTADVAQGESGEIGFQNLSQKGFEGRKTGKERNYRAHGCSSLSCRKIACG